MEVWLGAPPPQTSPRDWFPGQPHTGAAWTNIDTGNFQCTLAILGPRGPRAVWPMGPLGLCDLWDRWARGTWDPWAPLGPCARGPPVSPKATVEGKPFLETDPEGYHSRETIFGNRPWGPWPGYPGDLGPLGPCSRVGDLLQRSCGHPPLYYCGEITFESRCRRLPLWGNHFLRSKQKKMRSVMKRRVPALSRR